MTAVTIDHLTPRPPDDQLGSAPAVRRVPVPVAEPRPALRVAPRLDDAVAASQGTLSLTVDAPQIARLEATAVAQFCAAVPTSTSALPDPRRWAGQFVQAAVEVAAGQRPAAQLLRWTCDDVYATLARRGHLVARREHPGRADRRPGSATPAAKDRGRAVVHSVRVCTPRDGVAEASAVVSDRGRVRAVALRLEGLDGRWRVTALEIG